MEEKKTGEKKEKKEKTDENSGHYVIASSRLPKRQPLERRTLAPICGHISYLLVTDFCPPAIRTNRIKCAWTHSPSINITTNITTVQVAIVLADEGLRLEAGIKWMIDG